MANKAIILHVPSAYADQLASDYGIAEGDLSTVRLDIEDGNGEQQSVWGSIVDAEKVPAALLPPLDEEGYDPDSDEESDDEPDDEGEEEEQEEP